MNLEILLKRYHFYDEDTCVVIDVDCISKTFIVHKKLIHKFHKGKHYQRWLEIKTLALQRLKVVYRYSNVIEKQLLTLN